MKINIRVLYLYLLSFIGLLITVIGLVSLVNLGLKVFIFKGADEYVSYPRMMSREEMAGGKSEEQLIQEDKRFQEQQTRQQRQSTSAQALAMIIVGLPLYTYHWKLIQKQK